MTRRFSRWWIVPAVASFAVGCANKTDSTQAPPPAAGPEKAVVSNTAPTKPGAAAPGSDPATPAVELKETTVAGLEHAVRSQRGKVVLLDVWFFG